MSEHNMDYAAIQQNVEKRLRRQKWFYRIGFFVAHLLFFASAMLVVWGSLAANSQLRDLLFNSDSGAGLIVIVPTILWAAVVLFHVASLYFETGAGEKAIRQRLLMSEVGANVLMQQVEAGMSEKPKRHTALDAEPMQLTDDGEILPLDDDQRADPRDYAARTTRTGTS